MKTIHTLIATAAIIGSTLIATGQQPATSPDPQKQGFSEWRKKREFIESLPEEVRNQFRAAKEEAMKDPKVQALREKAEAASNELRDAVREVIASKNPELATKLGELVKSKDKDSGANEKKQRHDGQMESAIQKLPPAERDRLQAAREIAKQAPAVQSAEAAMKAAQTPENRREAAKNFHKAMRDAMLTADPSLADVLDKITPSKAETSSAASKETAPTAP